MNMEKKFTPGPWRHIGGIKNNRLYFVVFAKDQTSDTDRELQVFSMDDSHPDKEHLERRLADCKLIAAAPEMFDLLEKMLGYMPSIHGDDTFEKQIKALLTRITTTN